MYGSIIDYSSAGSVVSRNGLRVSNSIYKFGQYSLNTYSSGYCTATTSSINIRTDPFCIDCWVYRIDTNDFCIFSGGTGDVYLNTFSGSLYLGDGVINNITLSLTGILGTELWHHVSVSFDGTTYRLFIGGDLKASSTTLLKSINISSWQIGARTNAGLYLNGYIDDFRITKSARYTSNFSAPIVEAPNNSTDDTLFADVILLVRGNTTDIYPESWSYFTNSIQTFPYSGNPNTSVYSKDYPIVHSFYGGSGSIQGTVKIKGTPNIPVSRRVLLMRDKDFIIIKETWSDPITGTYEFTDLDPTITYTVLAHDHTQVYTAAISDYQIPA